MLKSGIWYRLLYKRTNLADDDEVSDSELENGDSLDGERQSLDAPPVVTRTLKLHAERVDDVRIGRHLPSLPAASQRLCRVNQTGYDVRDARLHRDGEVASVGTTVTYVHRADAVLL